jgi:hypothetical protein
VSLWLLRLAWLGVGFALGPAVGDALERTSGPVQWTAAAGLYATWAACLLATLAPRALGLTVVRVGGPASLAVTVWAVVAGGPPALSDLVALAWAALVAALSLAGTTADIMVDGSSYGAERRFALRVPLALLLGPAEAAWAAVAAGVAVGPLLLAAQQWVSGIAALIVGGAAAVIGARALHQLSRRWVVFVPAGVVLHDPLATTHTTLFRRGSVIGIGPALTGDAESGTTAVDQTGGAPGLVLELAIAKGDRIRFTPVRPGAVLAEAAERRLARVPS